MPKWSEQQLQAIQTTGRSLLVSAAAGSGKTATLSQRCVHITCLADHPCDITQLLVVTFTEAAAAEMKERIGKALLELQANLLGAGADDQTLLRVQKQLALLPGAQISTIHSFCAHLLRKHFQQALLDPDFRVLDEDESTLLKGEIATDLFEERFHGAPVSDFTRLVDLYADGNDEQIKARVISAYDVLRSLVDPAGWRERALGLLREAAECGDLAKTVLGRRYTMMVAQSINDLISHAGSVIAALQSIGGSGGYVNVARHIQAGLEQVAAALDRGEWAAARGLLDDCDTRLSGTKSCADPDTARKLLDALRGPFKSGGEIRLHMGRDPQALAREIAGTLPAAKAFLDLVDAFGSRYAAAKRQIQSVDFGDLEHLALEILKADDQRIARECRQRYASIMVDEFQDVNQVQWEIMSLVCRQQADGQPANLFCVGDVKQSIYRFRMADPFIFLAQRDDWSPKGHVIAMQHNYRSRDPLLQAINFVFAELMQNKAAAEIEYTASERLHGGRQFPPAEPGVFPGAPVELHVIVAQDGRTEAEDAEDRADDEREMDRVEREARYVANQIRDLMRQSRLVADKASGQLRPLRYGDIAILLRSARFAAIEYSRAMETLGIPCFAESRTGFFHATETNDLISILQLLDNQQQDIPMAAVLRSPIMRLPSPEDALARIRIFSRAAPFHDAVVRYVRDGKDDLAGELDRILNQLKRWRARAMMLTVADLLWEIIAESAYLAFCRGLPNGRQRVANVLYLHRCARRFSQFQRQGLFRFIQFLKQLQDAGDLGQPSPGEAGNAVQVMTIHKAKGLEFPVVIVSGIGAAFNQQDSRGALLVDRGEHLGISVADEAQDVRYPTAASFLVKDAIKRASKAEELRILYVAMTRAQEKLILVGSASAGQLDLLRRRGSPGKDPCVFRAARSHLDWLIPLTSLDPAGRHLCTVEANSADIHKSKPGEPLPPAPPAAVSDSQVPADFWDYQYPHAPFTAHPAAASVTGLSKGDEVPTDFTYDAVPHRAPAGENAAERGIALHRFMELFDFSASASAAEEQLAAMRSAGQITDAQAALIELDDVRWIASQSSVAGILREHAGGILREIPMLDAVTPESIATLPGGLDQVMLRGRIDAIAPTPSGLVVIDYKTDRNFPEPGSPRDLAYRKQMGLYRGAVQRSGLGPVAGVKLVFPHARRVLEL